MTLGEGGEESQDSPMGVENAFFLGGKLRGAFGQPAFFLDQKSHDHRHF